MSIPASPRSNEETSSKSASYSRITVNKPLRMPHAARALQPTHHMLGLDYKRKANQLVVNAQERYKSMPLCANAYGQRRSSKVIAETERKMVSKCPEMKEILAQEVTQCHAPGRYQNEQIQTKAKSGLRVNTQAKDGDRHREALRSCRCS